MTADSGLGLDPEPGLTLAGFSSGLFGVAMGCSGGRLAGAGGGQSLSPRSYVSGNIKSLYYIIYYILFMRLLLRALAHNI